MVVFFPAVGATDCREEKKAIIKRATVHGVLLVQGKTQLRSARERGKKRKDTDRPTRPSLCQKGSPQRAIGGERAALFLKEAKGVAGR